MKNTSVGKGFFFAILAFSLWGILPLYWKLLAAIDSLHILAFRILFSLILVGAILLANKSFSWLGIFKEPKKAGLMILTALLLCGNWGIYIWAINQGHTLEASLGYYINPLVSIILGLVFLRERLKVLQWVAVIIASIGVLTLTILSGSVPWVSLLLALTFGFYGLLKKKLTLPALESLGAETLASAPLGVLLLFVSLNNAGGGAGGGSSAIALSGLQGLEYLGNLPVYTLAALALAGLISSFPLYCFAHGAKLLPLSALGFIQFISPTINFFLALFVFGEEFLPHNFAAFAFIWAAVVIYIISLKKSGK